VSIEHDSDVALRMDQLLERLHGTVRHTAGTPGHFGCTVSYDFEDYFDACIFAELMRGRGNYHGEPCLWVNGKIRLVVSQGNDDPAEEAA
jgi:hypothetical protein